MSLGSLLCFELSHVRTQGGKSRDKRSHYCPEMIFFFVGVQKTFSGCLKLLYNLRSPFETVSNRSWKCLEFGVPKLVLVMDSKYCRFESGPTLNPKPPKSCQKPWKHVRESRKRHRNGLGSVSES